MRKLLLASTALVLTTGSALAADSETVQVTATVTATCSLTDPADVPFGADPLVGATANRTFSFTCNFSGDNSSTLAVKFQSTNGGLANPADGTDRSYTVQYGVNPAVTAASIEAPLFASYSETSATANVANPRSFDVTLAEALPVAGSYSDTLTVSIAP